MSEYTLYWNPNSSSLAVQAVLEEVGAAYELRLVDIAKGEHRSEAYRRINPNGLVPTLVLEDGTPVFESAAIVMYLADRYPEARLAPAPDAITRARYNQWLFYLADTLYPAYKRFYYPQRLSTDPADADKVRARAADDLLELWGIVDAELGDGPWLLGEQFSAADIYLMMFTLWQPDRVALLGRFPNVARTAMAVAERSAVRRALAQHGEG